ncbi:MAG: chromosomal replication initiator protein DnaA [Pseudomonadota bacterium]
MKDCWNRAVAHFQSSLTPHLFDTWLRPLQFRSLDEARVVVEVPNSFYRDRLEETYARPLRDKLRELAGAPLLDLTFVLAEEPSSAAPAPIFPPPVPVGRTPAVIEPDGPASNRRYTFEAFVVGTSNQFAHAAASATAASPGKTYNPLFIYGGVGLGKTHLLCAVGNRIAAQPGMRVVYRSTEQFMNELINAIRFEKTEEFRTRYRKNCDVLLLDDIQFLSRKERTQEEFFHTFNALHQANKQIVMTSDQTPREIPDLDERLRSRFQWGLFCDIQPPDVETRVAILKKKAAASSVELPDDAALFLATQVKSNVRVLEGAFIRLSAHASLSGQPITLALARDTFASAAAESPGLSVETIQRRVAEFFNLNVSDLKSPRRHKVVALPRQIAMYLSRKLTPASFPEIGERFGGKDHTTVMHGVSKIDRVLASDPRIRSTLAAIEQSLLS